MPRFSVIVPAYRVQAYLHACLDSVLSQSFTDYEIIVVDDCSPDACGPIADEYAARDPRVDAVHLPDNAGPGPARNAATARASGDYLIFLDGDDTLAPEALLTIADRITKAHSPDVLVYGHVCTDWSGERVPNPFARRLAGSGPEPFRLTDRPELLGLLLLTGVRNKAYRREFIEAGGFAFPPGYYEDIPWTPPVLMAAGAIAVLDAVCVEHRQRRRGSVLSTTTPRHFDIFDQYDRLFAYIGAHPGLAVWRPVMFRRMLDHFSTLFTSHGRLPHGAHGAFFRHARAHCRRYRSPGMPVPHRAMLRHALFRLGARRTYRTLWLARQLRGRLRHGSAALRRAVRGAVLQAHYRIQLRLPVRQNDAVFAAYRYRGYACSPAAIEAKARELVPGLRTAWICRTEDAHTLPEATRPLHPGTFSHWTALARSKYLVNNVDFDAGLVKRPGQVLLQTHHGTPLKKMGTDLLEHPAAARSMDFEQLLRDIDKWDYSLSANQHSTLVWERAYPSGYTTLEYGSPRNDVLHRADAAEVARLRETLAVPVGSIALLYAPTYRDYRRTQRHPLDLERLARALGPHFVVLARSHHLYGPPEAPAGRGTHPRIIDVSRHPSVEELCLASDVLVTDYSSLMFDYANLDRPVVLHLDDGPAYRAARGTYLDPESFPPGAVAHSQDQLHEIFATDHWRGARSAQRRAAFRARFCPYDDGHAAERVVRRVFLGETAGLPHPVPAKGLRPAGGLPRQLTVREYTNE